MKLFHGTTSDRIESIKATGLKAWSYCTTSRGLAEWFANQRHSERGVSPVVLVIVTDRHTAPYPLRSHDAGEEFVCQTTSPTKMVAEL